MGFPRCLTSGLRGTRAPRRHCRVRTTARQTYGRFEGKSQAHGRIRYGGGAGERYSAVTDISDDKLRESKRVGLDSHHWIFSKYAKYPQHQRSQSHIPFSSLFILLFWNLQNIR
jgi:hypothetical protein